MNAKTIFGVLLVSIMMVSSAFAADIDKMGGRWGLGAFGTTPTVRVNFTDIFSTQIGFGYQSPSSATVPALPAEMDTLLLLSFKNKTLGDGGKIAMSWGLLARYSSNVGFVSNNTSTRVGITVGFDTLVTPDFIVGITIIPAQYVSNVTGGGVTSNNNWGFLNEAVVSGHIFL